MPDPRLTLFAHSNDEASRWRELLLDAYSLYQMLSSCAVAGQPWDGIRDIAESVLNDIEKVAGPLYPNDFPLVITGAKLPPSFPKLPHFFNTLSVPQCQHVMAWNAHLFNAKAQGHFDLLYRADTDPLRVRCQDLAVALCRIWRNQPQDGGASL
jgi:hypothetical protein